MSDNLIIRSFQQRDLSSLLLIESQSEYSLWKRSHFEAEIGNAATSRSNILITAFQENSACTVAGYICFRSLWEEVYILKVSVRRKFRRRGVATALMNQAIGEGTESGAERAVLEVAPSNSRAMGLYRKIGFKFPDCKLKSGSDSLIMLKIL